MSSKLDYLKKYLAKPGESGGATKPGKEKRKHKKGAAPEPKTLEIRDVSEVLPAFRGDRERKPGRHITGDLLGPSAPPEEPVLVDQAEVDEAARARAAEIETSGVAWRIQQHRPDKPRPGARSVVKEELGAKEEDGSDLSPPRAGGNSAAAARGRPGAGGDSDLSPPRTGASAAAAGPRDADSDLSPPRGATAAARAGADSDLSPPREAAPPAAAGGSSDGPRAAIKKPKLRVKEESGSEQDLSPPRRGVAEAGAAKRRHDSDDDLSPPRAAAVSKASDQSKAAPRQRHDSDDDLSPPREAPAGKAAERTRHDSDDDLSPPRAAAGKAAPRQRHDSDADLSPPRASATGKENSKPKAVAGRQRHDSDSDLSPPRADNKEEDDEPEKMTSGLRAGLVRGADLKEEAAQVRAERRAAVDAAPDSETGRNATTVYRSKAGHRIEREEWVQQQQKKRRKKISDYPEQELEWGGGVKQKANEEEEKAELERIAAQPFARYEPDIKAQEELMERMDWNDPMRKFKDDEDALGPGAQKAQKPKCPHPPWPNRFGILPGYRWDGKHRGNNFETKWLQTKNQREYKKKAFIIDQVNDCD